MVIILLTEYFAQSLHVLDHLYSTSHFSSSLSGEEKDSKMTNSNKISRKVMDYDIGNVCLWIVKGLEKQYFHRKLRSQKNEATEVDRFC